jgi:hypothetical protein
VSGFLRRFLRRSTRLERLLEAHNRVEADLEALAGGTREVPPWTDEQLERLREVMRKDGEER